MMRALIVDDEVYSREEMEALLIETGEFQVCGKCANALEAMQALHRDKPEVLFLDVQMPMINGFELLTMIDEAEMPRVVFVTAHDEYALKAFEENAFDYLLKPVERVRLLKTVEKLKRRLSEGAAPLPLPAGAEIKKIPCLQASRIKLVNCAEVEYVRSDGAGVYVVGPFGQLYTELTLQVLEAKTPLIRCHKQFLVNIDLADEILLQENAVAEIRTKSGHRVPVSRRYLKILREKWRF